MDFDPQRSCRHDPFTEIFRADEILLEAADAHDVTARTAIGYSTGKRSLRNKATCKKGAALVRVPDLREFQSTRIQG